MKTMNTDLSSETQEDHILIQFLVHLYSQTTGHGLTALNNKGFSTKLRHQRSCLQTISKHLKPTCF